MKKSIMCGALLYILVGVAGLTSKAQRTDFSGLWKVNLEKSEFEGIPSNSATQEYKVEQNQKELSLIWVTKNQKNEEVTSSQKLSIDGEKVAALLPSGRTRYMSATSSKDGKSITLIKSYSKVGKPETPDYAIEERWELTDVNKALIVELTSPGYTIKVVYDKAKVSE